MRVRAVRLSRPFWTQIKQYAAMNGMTAAEFVREAVTIRIERGHADLVKPTPDPQKAEVSPRQFKTTDEFWNLILSFAQRNGLSASELVRVACQERIQVDARARTMLDAGTAAQVKL